LIIFLFIIIKCIIWFKSLKFQIKFQKKNSNSIDLNIGVQCLDNWEIYHAIRELIANGIDEHINSRLTESIDIIYSRNNCTIIDYGSGITKSNFILQTNPTKLNNDKTIGQFGFGLKDALAVLCRNELKVTIYTKDYIFTPSYTQRQSTTDITLHIKYVDNDDYNEDEDDYGTKFVIENIKKTDVDKAKEYFMNYTPVSFDKLYANDITKFTGKSQFMFVNGFRVSKTNTQTHFSYNFKKTMNLMKQFNRDRREQNYDIFKTMIQKQLQNIVLFDDSYSSDKLCNEIQKVFESNDLREFNQIDVIRNILSQFNKTDEYIFVDIKDVDLVKKKKYQDTIKNSKRKIMYIGEGVLKKINLSNKGDKIKNIKELYNGLLIFKDDQPGLFTLSSPSMFPPDLIEPFVTKIKELITKIKDVLEIQISEKVEKTLTTIELIDDDDDVIVIDGNEKDKIDYKDKSEDGIEDEVEDEVKNEVDNKNKDYYFEDGVFKIKKSIIQDDTKKNELKAVVFDYILKNIKSSESIIILEKLLINKKNQNQTKSSWFNFF
jgi:hypothetical protein